MNKSQLKELIHQEIIESSYELMTEIINLAFHYDYDRKRKNAWYFTDKANIYHFIIIHKKLTGNLDQAEVKFGWVDILTGQPRYDKPGTYDEKIFNTHLYILINEILPLHLNTFEDGIILTPTDELRYRLYRIALNKELNKSKYSLIEINKTLIIKSK